MHMCAPTGTGTHQALRVRAEPEQQQQLIVKLELVRNQAKAAGGTWRGAGGLGRGQWGHWGRKAHGGALYDGLSGHLRGPCL